MKKNRTMRVAVLLMALTLMTSCFVGNTFAKYTSSANGADTVSVAKWSFQIGGTEIANAVTQTVTFNLFNTVYDSNGTDIETDVIVDKIAPGTSGAFTIELANTSEVTADYKITFAQTNANSIPIEYSVDDGVTWSFDIATLTIEGDNLNYGAGTTTASKVVQWRWQYGDVAGYKSDVTDTLLGIYAQNASATPSVTITANVTAWQVD